MISVATSYLRSGLCVLPAIVAQKRPALRGWKQYQARLPTEAEIASWFADVDALCLICGAVSGNLEMIDFDFEAELFASWRERIQAKMPAILDRLLVERSQSGGKHVVYRCESPISGNLKLAQRIITTADEQEITIGKKRHKPRRVGDHHEIALTLIETRGEGGLFLCAPTSGYVLERGDFANLPVLTKAERDLLIETAQTLDESAARPATPASPVTHETCENPLTLGASAVAARLTTCDTSQNVEPLAPVEPLVTHNTHDNTAQSVTPARPETCETHKSPLTPLSPEPLVTCDDASGTSRTGTDETSGRPGDEYNSRGDVRTLLQRYGWRCALGGDNEHWRRPGKDSGWSATLKDRVFYVFSSNAAPFEPNRGYSPFAVYALLEHHGDFEEAARTLRLEGFGDEPAAELEKVDLSTLVANLMAPISEHKLAVSDPGPIPECLFNVPGFVRQVMDFTLANAPYPNVGLAFCGAMALQSFLAGRKVCTSGDLRPNLYLLALASSGAGKDFPRKVNSRMLFEIGLVGAVGDKFASGEGIQDALARSNAMLFQNDEMDGVLRQINLDREGRRESIPNILLTLYTSANDVYPIRVKAGQKETIHIDQPHLTLFGTATPRYFYESLSQRMLTNGFFARMIIVDVGRRGAGQTPGSARNLPDSLVNTARWWAEYKPTVGNLQNAHPEPHVVPFSSDAARAIKHLQQMAETEYDQAEEANDEVARTVWSRTCENATKLALIYACSENHENPLIRLPAVEWATAFAMHQARRQLYLAATYVAENPFHAACLKLMQKLKEAPNRQLPHSVLLKRMKIDARTFQEIITTLEQQGDVIIVNQSTTGRPQRGYQLIDDGSAG